MLGHGDKMLASFLNANIGHRAQTAAQSIGVTPLQFQNLPILQTPILFTGGADACGNDIATNSLLSAAAACQANLIPKFYIVPSVCPELARIPSEPIFSQNASPLIASATRTTHDVSLTGRPRTLDAGATIVNPTSTATSGTTIATATAAAAATATAAAATVTATADSSPSVSKIGTAWRKVYHKLCQDKIKSKLDSVLRERGLEITDLQRMDLTSLREIWRITHRRWHSSHRCHKDRDHRIASAGGAAGRFGNDGGVSKKSQTDIQARLERVLQRQPALLVKQEASGRVV